MVLDINGRLINHEEKKNMKKKLHFFKNVPWLELRINIFSSVSLAISFMLIHKMKYRETDVFA